MNYQNKSRGLKKIMPRFFLYRVYRFNKKLFIFFVSFAGLTLACNLAGLEITPFYVWGMYSEKEAQPNDYEILKLTVNNKVADYTAGYLPENRLFLQVPVKYYAQLKNKKDPTEVFLKAKLKGKFSMIEPYASQVLNSTKEVEEFPLWYKRYLQQTTGETVQNFKVEILHASYDTNNTIKINSGYTLIDGR